MELLEVRQLWTSAFLFQLALKLTTEQCGLSDLLDS